jgi:hypothetical protein
MKLSILGIDLIEEHAKVALVRGVRAGEAVFEEH